MNISAFGHNSATIIYNYTFLWRSRFNLITIFETILDRPSIHTFVPSLYITVLLYFVGIELVNFH